VARTVGATSQDDVHQARVQHDWQTPVASGGQAGARDGPSYVRGQQRPNGDQRTGAVEVVLGSVEPVEEFDCVAAIHRLARTVPASCPTYMAGSSHPLPRACLHRDTS